MVHQMLSDGNLKFAQLLRNALVTKVAATVIIITHVYSELVKRCLFVVEPVDPSQC